MSCQKALLICMCMCMYLCECVCFTRPGRATGNAAATLVGQCAINPFISTSPSLLSASISPLTHHRSIHPTSHFLLLTYTREVSTCVLFWMSSFRLTMPNEVCKWSQLTRCMHAISANVNGLPARIWQMEMRRRWQSSASSKMILNLSHVKRWKLFTYNVILSY